MEGTTQWVLVLVGSLSNYEDDHNDDFKKTIGFHDQTCITLFSTFLWRPLHDYDVKLPNLTFYGGRGHTMTNFPSSFLNLNKILKNSTPGNVACIWHIERVQIDAIKFERTQIHFFVRFHCRRCRPCLMSLVVKRRHRANGLLSFEKLQPYPNNETNKQITNKEILKTLGTHNNISISPNRWGEMCVAIQGKTIVKEIFWRQGASREVKGIWHGLSSKGTNNLQGARKKIYK